MKIIYDSVSDEYIYPLTKKDVRGIKDYVSSEILRLVRLIRFGCNLKTPQEGRTVKRGKYYDIRINFCLRRMGDRLQSQILLTKKKYMQDIKRYGGKPDLNTQTIEWELRDAKRYAFFLLSHEMGHVVYSEKNLPGGMASSHKKNSPKEEEWCDDYSKQVLNRMIKSLLV